MYLQFKTLIKHWIKCLLLHVRLLLWTMWEYLPW